MLTPLALSGQPTTGAAELSIGDVVRIAMRDNGTLRANSFVVDQADARVLQARSALFPSVGATMGNRQRTFNSAELGITLPAAPGAPPFFDPDGEVLGPINIYDARVRVSQPLLAPAARAHWASARAAAEAARAEEEVSGTDIALRAALAFVALQRATGHVSARLDDSTLAERLLATAREQLRAGTGIELDVTRAESQAAMTRAQLIAARATRDRASLELAQLLSIPLDQPVHVSRNGAPVSTLDSTTLDGALSTMRTRRAELRALDARARAAEQRLRGVASERWPSLTAFGDNGMIGRGVDALRYTYNWGIQLSVPLFDASRASRAVEQRGTVREVDERRRDLERTISMEVRIALIDLAAAREQVEAATIRRTLAEREVAQATDRFVAGVANNADVVAASLTLNSVRTTYIDALAARETARVALARAQGTLADLP